MANDAAPRWPARGSAWRWGAVSWWQDELRSGRWSKHAINPAISERFPRRQPPAARSPTPWSATSGSRIQAAGPATDPPPRAPALVPGLHHLLAKNRPCPDVIFLRHSNPDRLKSATIPRTQHSRSNMNFNRLTGAALALPVAISASAAAAQTNTAQVETDRDDGLCPSFCAHPTDRAFMAALCPLCRSSCATYEAAVSTLERLLTRPGDTRRPRYELGIAYYVARSTKLGATISAWPTRAAG